MLDILTFWLIAALGGITVAWPPVWQPLRNWAQCVARQTSRVLKARPDDFSPFQYSCGHLTRGLATPCKRHTTSRLNLMMTAALRVPSQVGEQTGNASTVPAWGLLSRSEAPQTGLNSVVFGVGG